MTSLTASALLDSQASLLQEAAEALPHSFSQCTHHLGYIRQAVYLCHTCNERRGICSACSIACHTDHEQLELFPKRKFRCDCPTKALKHPCSLYAQAQQAQGRAIVEGEREKLSKNTENGYNHNFEGCFCRCGRTYDANLEIETMIQCLACEDWFHESCLNLRERPSGASRAPSPAVQSKEHPDNPASALDVHPDGDHDDGASDTSSSGLPPPLFGASAYDAFVCANCVRGIDTLKKYAGTAGVLMIIRNEGEESKESEKGWKVIGKASEDGPGDVDIDGVGMDMASKVNEDDEAVTAGQKRAREDSESGSKTAVKDEEDADGGTSTKRQRTNSETNGGPHTVKTEPAANIKSHKMCLAPPPSPLAQRTLSASCSNPKVTGTGDVFLTEGWRERWCRCLDCLPSLEAHPYLLREDETYEPPDDPDVGLSLEELGLRALQRIPRERAIDGIHAFNAMRDQLMDHLRPFAQEGKVVTEEDIRAFFEERMRGAGREG